MRKNDIIFSSYQLGLPGDFYRSSLSVSRFARKKGIARITLRCWVRIFGDSNPGVFTYMKKNKSPRSSDESFSIITLRLGNECLRAEFKDTKMRAHAFNTMIGVAEEMLNLPIRKKAGIRQ